MLAEISQAVSIISNIRNIASWKPFKSPFWNGLIKGIQAVIAIILVLVAIDVIVILSIAGTVWVAHFMSIWLPMPY